MTNINYKILLILCEVDKYKLVSTYSTKCEIWNYLWSHKLNKANGNCWKLYVSMKMSNENIKYGYFAYLRL